MYDIRCKVCDRGALIPKKTHRMSKPVVLIGYLLLIPSVLGILFSLLMFVSAAHIGAGTAANAHDASVNAAATGIAGGISILFGIASFVGGLLGWLLVMKKSVLECNYCRASINAA